MTRPQRNDERPDGWVPVRDECGTRTGYDKHRYLNEPVCAGCRIAYRRWYRQYRARKNDPNYTPNRDTSPIECGTFRGYQAHVRAREPACRPCKDAYAAWYRQYRARKKPATPYISRWREEGFVDGYRAGYDKALADAGLNLHGATIASPTGGVPVPATDAPGDAGIREVDVSRLCAQYRIEPEAPRFAGATRPNSLTQHTCPDPDTCTVPGNWNDHCHAWWVLGCAQDGCPACGDWIVTYFDRTTRKHAKSAAASLDADEARAVHLEALWRALAAYDPTRVPLVPAQPYLAHAVPRTIIDVMRRDYASRQDTDFAHHVAAIMEANPQATPTQLRAALIGRRVHTATITEENVDGLLRKYRNHTPVSLDQLRDDSGFDPAASGW